MLRLSLGMQQQEMADLLNCSRSLVQSIELKRTPLTEEMAGRACIATGVSVHWLLDNDRTKPIEGRFGVPFTKEYYENWRAGMEGSHSALSAATTPGYLFGYYEQSRHLLALMNREQSSLFHYWMDGLFKRAAKELLGKKIKMRQNNFSAHTLDLVRKDWESVMELSLFLATREDKSSNVSAMPEVKKIAADVKRHLKESKGSPFPPQE